MAENFFKAIVLGAWAGVLGYSVVAWAMSGIKRGVEEAWAQRSQGNSPDLRIVSEKRFV